jgi:release factor family 3
MDTLKGELASFQSLKDMKSMLSSEAPCLSVYMMLGKAGVNQGAKQNDLRWQECLRNAEEKIKQYGAQGRELLESIASWDAVAQGQEAEGKSVAVFRGPDTLQTVWLEDEVTDRAVVGPHFYIRPLLREMTRDKAFYILALSQKDVRLLRCTTRTSEDVPFAPGTTTNYEHWMNSVKPDHNDTNRGTTGPSSGSSKGAIAPMGADREAKDEYLSHFYKQIEHGVAEVLRGHTEPLVLVGVEYELPIYRELNRYPHLAKESVQGAPNSLKSGEMHARALEALERCHAMKVDEALAEWNHKVGGGASSRLKDVVTAAHDGRILTLIVSDSFEKTGSFDEATHAVKGRETGGNEDEDLINDAAVQTVLHAGNVLVAPHHKMPNGAPLAAIFRF